MNPFRFARFSLALVCSFSAFPQNGEVPGVPVSVIVSAEAKHGNNVPPLTGNQLKVREAGSDRPIESLNRFAPDAPVQVMLLLDDSATDNFDVQIPALKKWVNSLPSNVQIGVSFMHNGTVEVAHAISPDHAAVANTIHLSLGFGGADVSPYDSLSEAIKQWPSSEGVRREVLMVTSGIEDLGGGAPPNNPYVNKSIKDAQRAGVLVFGIYNPSVGHLSHTFWIGTIGQSLLSQLCEETGGEAYITTISAPVSFDPFLEEFTGRLGSQYSLTFMAGAENKSGLQPLKVSVHDDNADAAAPAAVFVKASK